MDLTAVIHREYFGMEDAKKIRTPVDSSIKLVKGGDEDACVDRQLYQSAVGCLLYLSNATRPDITFAVSFVQNQQNNIG